MLRTNNSRLLSFFIGSSGYLVPRPRNEAAKLSKTMHPYLLGKRDIYYFYNLEKSLYGIRATLEVLKKIIGSGGEVLFLSDSPLFKLVSNENATADYIKWKRSSLSQCKRADLIFLDNVGKENLVEAHRKSTLMTAVGSSTMSKMSYPFNLNVSQSLLSDWFFSSLSVSCNRQTKKEIKPFPNLLGKGVPKKKAKKKNEVQT